ncbi:translation initiation factor IF-2-like [Schistocerca cancellata]|uniref:translation initiation factor IF-2-like n=1 Tax=Schistocerca cancellata TaxID=274614 RepID=UPI00211954DD|nr:translation initiation factor IF-2-like [Schistocerca cancellata]
MEEGEAEAAPEVEEEPGDAGGQEEGEVAASPSEETEAGSAEAAEKAEQTTVPVKARIICASGEEPLTIGKALVPGGSPLHMEVPGAGTLVLTASLKAPPEPSSPASAPGPGGEVKCLCPTSKKRGGGAEEQIKALATTMEQISSMQQLLSDMQNTAQALSRQLTGGGRGPPPTQPVGVPRPLPYDFPGGMQMQQRAMPPADFGRVPPGGKEVFSAPGVGIYVVQKDASAMGGGMPYDYMSPMADPRSMQPAASCPACDTMLPLPPPDMGQRDWASPQPMAASQSRGAEACQPGGGGHVCCGGGGQMVCCGGGGMSCCGGGRVLCCGGGVKISCCGGGVPVSCCGARLNTCCGGGGGGGGGPHQQQQAGGYPRMPDEQEVCQGDCTIPCDSTATCMGRTR